MGDTRRIYRGTCQQCEAERQRLSRLAVVLADGVRHDVMVCRYCFIVHVGAR